MSKQIDGQPIINGKSSFYKAQTAQDVKKELDVFKKVLHALKDSEGITVLRTKVRDNASKDAIDLQSKTNESNQEIQQDTQKQTNQISTTDQSGAAMLDTGEQSLAAIMAALEQEETFGLTNEQTKDLNEKLDLLLAQAENLRDVELEDPDAQYELQQMFHNLDKLKQLRDREIQLARRLEDAQIKLKEQETKAALNQLPVDETTKKMREQLLHTYDVSSDHQPSDQPNDDANKEDTDTNRNDDDSSDHQSSDQPNDDANKEDTDTNRNDDDSSELEAQ